MHNSQYPFQTETLDHPLAPEEKGVLPEADQGGQVHCFNELGTEHDVCELLRWLI